MSNLAISAVNIRHAILTTISLFIFFKGTGQAFFSANNIDVFFGDSVIAKRNGRVDTLLIGYKKGGEQTSVIIDRIGNKQYTYEDVLFCYQCKEKGAPGFTYGGYSQIGNVLGFCQIDFLGIDTLYMDIGSIPPIYLGSVHRPYYSEEESYRTIPIAKMNINQYKNLRFNDSNHLLKSIPIKWKSPLSHNLATYQTNKNWSANYLFIDTVNLGNGVNVYLGFDYRSSQTLILYEKNKQVFPYYNILYWHPNETDSMNSLKVYKLKNISATLVFVQQYSTYRDSIFIDFKNSPATYRKIVHSNFSKVAKTGAVFLPKVKVPITTARSIYGDIFCFPENKNELFQVLPVK